MIHFFNSAGPLSRFAAVVSLSTFASWARAGSFTPLGSLDQTNAFSNVIAISRDGSAVVGNTVENGHVTAYRRQAGTMISLGNLKNKFTEYSEAGGVSRDGSVVSGMSLSPNGTEAFRWEAGIMTGLGDLPGDIFYSHGFEVSGDGSTVVGISRTGDVGDHPFRWVGGVMHDLFDDFPKGAFPPFTNCISDDGSTIVGFEFRWRLGVVEFIDPPIGAQFAMPLQISDDGSVIVGHATFNAARTEAFRWENGEYQLLGDLPGGAIDSRAMGVSGDGSIVVGAASTASGMRPFIWDAQHGMRNLVDVLSRDFALNLTDMTLTEAVGISGDGLKIAGNAVNENGRPEAWLADLSCADGDLNHDGSCSTLDIEPLLDCLLLGMPCGCADLNLDDHRDGQDIRALVDCIVTP